MSLRILACFLLVLFSVGGCTKSGDDGGGGGDEPVPGEVQTDCGVVTGGKLKNPVALADGKPATVKSSNGNTVIVSTAEGDILVKLLGIGSIDHDLRPAVASTIQELSAGGVTFFPADPACSISVDGGNASGGTIITGGGISLAEELIHRGLVQYIDSGSACGENLVSSCMEALMESSPRILGMIDDFLWKPESDGQKTPGKLVVLLSACNADIVVNGEHLQYDGPSNGRCSLGRSNSKTGCDFGANVKVEVFDQDNGGVYLFPDGKPYYTVRHGCNREEFKH